MIPPAETESGNVMQGFDKSVTVFFPTYNEEENIERAVNQAAEVLEAFCRDFEIII